MNVNGIGHWPNKRLHVLDPFFRQSSSFPFLSFFVSWSGILQSSSHRKVIASFVAYTILFPICSISEIESMCVSWNTKSESFFYFYFLKVLSVCWLAFQSDGYWNEWMRIEYTQVEIIYQNRCVSPNSIVRLEWCFRYTFSSSIYLET